MDPVWLFPIGFAFFCSIVVSIVAFVVARKAIKKMEDQKTEVEVEPEETELPVPEVDRALDAEREVYANSPTPWVKLISDQYDPQTGFKITLDWNQAFVDQLDKNGYAGIDDNQKVQKWLAQTAMNVAQDLNQESFDNMLVEPDVADDDGSLSSI